MNHIDFSKWTTKEINNLIMKANRELYHRSFPGGAEIPSIGCDSLRNKNIKIISRADLTKEDKETIKDAFYKSIRKIKQSLI